MLKVANARKHMYIRPSVAAKNIDVGTADNMCVNLYVELSNEDKEPLKRYVKEKQACIQNIYCRLNELLCSISGDAEDETGSMATEILKEQLKLR